MTSPFNRGVGPAVRNLLESYNLTPDAVQASGPGGRLMKGDILDFVKAKGLQPVRPADGQCSFRVFLQSMHLPSKVHSSYSTRRLKIILKKYSTGEELNDLIFKKR